MDICANFVPELKDAGDGHFIACHLMDVSEEEKQRAYEKNMAERAKLEEELEEISAI